MKTAVFFASLIFFLLSGNVTVIAGNNVKENHCPPELQINNSGLLQLSGEYSFLSTSSLHKEDKILICEEVEDEDTNDASSRKYRTADSYLCAPFYRPILSFYDVTLPAFHSSCHQFSRRFIMLRTLRI